VSERKAANTTQKIAIVTGFQAHDYRIRCTCEVKRASLGGSQAAGTAEQMKALFQRVGMNTVAILDSLRDGKWT
jgi:hypothetical protein